MIRLSHEHKAIFCHIPRTGGTSMEHVLQDWARISWNRYGVKRFNERFIGSGQFIVEMLPDYFTFTTVRNPYDRYLSGLSFYEYTSNEPEAIGHWAKDLTRKRFWMQEHLLATQCEILGDLKPDYIMRLESIDEDFQFIRDKFGLTEPMPKLNGINKGPLTKDVIKLVNGNYAEDFKRFGYDSR